MNNATDAVRLDETWVNTGHSGSRVAFGLTSHQRVLMNDLISKGTRLILLHAGLAEGLSLV